MVDISVIIPVFNENEGVDRCYREVVAHLEATPYTFEIIFVDDGSTDGSTERLRAIAVADKRVQLIKLLCNVGQQHAMYIALLYAKGRAAITYDSDLQFPPTCLPQLAGKVFEGYDIVGGYRAERSDSILINRIPSWFGRKLINQALQTEIRDFGGVKAYSSRMVRTLLAINVPRVVIPAMAYSVSRNAIEIPVGHTPRLTGASKWSILSRMELYFDVYTLYARRPFATIMLGGILSFVAGSFLGFGLLMYKLLAAGQFSGLLIFFDLFLLATGAYFFSLALIGEFVVRSFRGKGFQVDDLVEEVVKASGDDGAALPTMKYKAD